MDGLSKPDAVPFQTRIVGRMAYVGWMLLLFKRGQSDGWLM